MSAGFLYVLMAPSMQPGGLATTIWESAAKAATKRVLENIIASRVRCLGIGWCMRAMCGGVCWMDAGRELDGESVEWLNECGGRNRKKKLKVKNE